MEKGDLKHSCMPVCEASWKVVEEVRLRDAHAIDTSVPQVYRRLDDAFVALAHVACIVLS